MGGIRENGDQRKWAVFEKESQYYAVKVIHRSDPKPVKKHPPRVREQVYLSVDDSDRVSQTEPIVFRFVCRVMPFPPGGTRTDNWI